MSRSRLFVLLVCCTALAACDSASPDLALTGTSPSETTSTASTSNSMVFGELFFDVPDAGSGADMYLVRRDGQTLGCEAGPRTYFQGFGYHTVVAQYVGDEPPNDCDLFSTQFFTVGDYVAYVPGQANALTLDFRLPGSSECVQGGLNHDSSYRYSGSFWSTNVIPPQTCVVPSIDPYDLDQRHAVLAENYYSGGILLAVSLLPSIAVDGRGSFDLGSVERSDVRFRYTRPNGTTATTWRYNVGRDVEVIVTPKNNTSVQVMSRLRSQTSETHTTSHYYTTSTGDQDVPCKRFDTRPKCNLEL